MDTPCRPAMAMPPTAAAAPPTAPVAVPIRPLAFSFSCSCNHQLRSFSVRRTASFCLRSRSSCSLRSSSSSFSRADLACEGQRRSNTDATHLLLVAVLLGLSLVARLLGLGRAGRDRARRVGRPPDELGQRLVARLAGDERVPLVRVDPVGPLLRRRAGLLVGAVLRALALDADCALSFVRDAEDDARSLRISL